MSKNPMSAQAVSRLRTHSRFSENALTDIEAAMNGILADAFALYFKIKNFHWHASGPNFRDYHLMFDEHAAQVLAATDDIAERVRKLGGTTLRSVNQIAAMTRVQPNEASFVEPADMIAELMEDNMAFAAALQAAHDVCDEHGDTATSSFIDTWIDEAERRAWFLFEASRPAMSGGH